MNKNLIGTKTSCYRSIRLPTTVARAQSTGFYVELAELDWINAFSVQVSRKLPPWLQYANETVSWAWNVYKSSCLPKWFLRPPRPLIPGSFISESQQQLEHLDWLAYKFLSQTFLCWVEAHKKEMKHLEANLSKAGTDPLKSHKSSRKFRPRRSVKWNVKIACWWPHWRLWRLGNAFRSHLLFLSNSFNDFAIECRHHPCHSHERLLD